MAVEGEWPKNEPVKFRKTRTSELKVFLPTALMLESISNIILFLKVAGKRKSVGLQPRFIQKKEPGEVKTEVEMFHILP